MESLVAKDDGKNIWAEKNVNTKLYCKAIMLVCRKNAEAPLTNKCIVKQSRLYCGNYSTLGKKKNDEAHTYKD